MTAFKPKLMTVNEFEIFISQPEHAERSWEFINGEIVEKVPTQLHGLIAALLASVLVTFLRTHPVGWVMVEARYRLPDDNENDYIPDVSFVSKEKGPLVEKGPAPYMPDFVIEIKSPDDKISDMRKKAAYYLAHGSRLVWLVYTEKKQVIVLTADSEVTLTEGEHLNGGNVLAGFELPVRDIFPE